MLATLEPLDGSRKFCRLVSGVLIERTVAEVIPAVKGNRDVSETRAAGIAKLRGCEAVDLDLGRAPSLQNLGQIIASLKNQMEGKQKEIAAFQTKYKITVRSGPAGDKDGAAPENKGVLV